jgi:hypothetical protein
MSKGKYFIADGAGIPYYEPLTEIQVLPRGKHSHAKPSDAADYHPPVGCSSLACLRTATLRRPQFRTQYRLDVCDIAAKAARQKTLRIRATRQTTIRINTTTLQRFDNQTPALAQSNARGGLATVSCTTRTLAIPFFLGRSR